MPALPLSAASSAVARFRLDRDNNVPVCWITRQDICLQSATVVFFGYLANFLEKHRAEFHYSVIGRFATVFLASGYVGGHLLNDDDAASNSKVGVRASCAELASSSRS